MLTSEHLLGVRQDGNRLVCVFRNAFSRDITELSADTVIIDKGTQPMLETYTALLGHSTNLGELDYDALTQCQPQNVKLNASGTYQLFRVGDAWTGRDIHAALFDSNRLCRVV